MEHYISPDQRMTITVPPRTAVYVVPYDELRRWQMILNVLRFPDQESEYRRIQAVTEIEMVLLCNAPPPDSTQ